MKPRKWVGFAQFSRSDGVYGPKTQATVIEAQKRFAGRGTFGRDRRRVGAEDIGRRAAVPN